jgi:4-hydroxybenzoate polyprenyltransferase
LAIVLHWTLNFIAFSIALYLSWKQHSFWYLFIHLFSINALWIYSTQLKRRFLIGNIVIAALTGLVPILSALYFIHYIPEESNNLTTTYQVIYLASFAALLNFIREIIKDMEDVKGDLLLRATTIPIKIGIPKSKRIVIVLLLGTLLFASFLVSNYFHHLTMLQLSLTLMMGFCFLLVIYYTANNQLKAADRILKIAMIIGCTLPFYW